MNATCAHGIGLTALIVLLTILAVPSVSHGSPARNTLRFETFGAVTVEAPEDRGGVGFALSYEFRPLPFFGVFAGYGATFFPGAQSFLGEAGAIQNVGGGLRAHFLAPSGREDLWIAVGGRATFIDERTRGSLSLSMGLDLIIAEYVRVGPFVRYEHLFAQDQSPQGRAWGYLQFGINLVGIIGGERPPPPDRDDDGFVDPMDACPDEPEDFDRFRDGDGCPEPDNDNDGILDGDDECPIDAEDVDGDRDDDGCPEDPSDRDIDGIEDRRDECPDDPEDFDLFEDDDGCPDLDDDRDGIPDLDDACQMEPEVFNGYRDADGCPDRVPAAVRDLRRLGERFYFEHNADQLAEGSEGLIQTVARLILSNPQWSIVEIQGHASELGSQSYNLDLSRRRAEGIRRSLVNEHGVPAARLRVRAFGETQPEVTEENEESMARNRRVTFEIVFNDTPDPGSILR